MEDKRDTGEEERALSVLSFLAPGKTRFLPCYSTSARLVGLGARVGARGERWDILCSLPPPLRERAGERSWLWRWWEGDLLCLRQHSPCCRLSHWAQGLFLPLCFSFLVSLHTSTVPLSLSLPPFFSFSLHAFLSLLSSACRNTLTCCMSPFGNPACHLSIYLKETRFILLIAEPGIYWCIFIGCGFGLKKLGTR